MINLNLAWTNMVWFQKAMQSERVGRGLILRLVWEPQSYLEVHNQNKVLASNTTGGNGQAEVTSSLAEGHP